MTRTAVLSPNVCFRPIADIRTNGHTAHMLETIRSPWFAFAAAGLLASLSLFFDGERYWLLGMAGTAAFWGVIDWLGSNSEDQN